MLLIIFPPLIVLEVLQIQQISGIQKPTPTKPLIKPTEMMNENEMHLIECSGEWVLNSRFYFWFTVCYF